MNALRDNPVEIIQTLDGELDHEVSLVVYGRGALRLGFSEGLSAYRETQDVDGIIPLWQLHTLEEDSAFWDAVERTNSTLEPRGLYITHLFQEDQVFLRPEWEQHILPVVRPPTRWLKLFRPHTLDLILTKMMRGRDPQDMEDVAFMVQHDRITSEQMEPALATVRIPDIPELHDAFQAALPLVRSIIASNSAS